MLDPFMQFTLILLVLVGVSFIVRMLIKWPQIIAYIMSGIIASAFFIVLL